MAARADKVPRTGGPVTRSGAVAKATAPTKLSDSARDSIRDVLFPKTDQPVEVSVPSDVAMTPTQPV